MIQPVQTRSGESGMALLVVLWTLLLIGIIGASVASQARQQGLQSRNGVAIARAEAAAEAGVIRGVAALLDLRPEAVWLADGSIHRFVLDGIDIEVRIVDEAGKVDINATSPELLASLLEVCGASAETADGVATAVAELRRGATTGRPRGFETTSELVGMPGMTPALYERVAPFVTVLTHAPGIDPSVASPELLKALASRDPSLAPTIEATRGSPNTAVALPQSGFLTPSQHAIFSIDAVATVDRARFAREATIRLTHNVTLPFLVHGWRRLSSTPIRPIATSPSKPG